MHLVGFLQPRITMHGTTNIKEYKKKGYDLFILLKWTPIRMAVLAFAWRNNNKESLCQCQETKPFRHSFPRFSFVLRQVVRWCPSSKLQLMLPSRCQFTTLNPYTLKSAELFFRTTKVSNQLAGQNFLLVVSSSWFSQFTVFILITIASEGRTGETWESSKMLWLFLLRLIVSCHFSHDVCFLLLLL